MDDRVASLITKNRIRGVLGDFLPKCFVALLEDTKMKRNSKKEASISDFWGGIVWLRRDI